MNTLQISPLSGLTAPTAPTGSPAGGATPAPKSKDALQQPPQPQIETAAPVAPIVRHKAPPPVAAPVPVIDDKPRFNRNVGFVPGASLKVFIDLVDPNNKNVAYRIYGPRGAAPVLEQASPESASAAYSRSGGEPAGGKDVGVA